MSQCVLAHIVKYKLKNWLKTHHESLEYGKCLETEKEAKSFEYGKFLETEKTAKSFEYGKCLETAKAAKSFEYGKCLEIGKQQNLLNMESV